MSLARPPTPTRPHKGGGSALDGQEFGARRAPAFVPHKRGPQGGKANAVNLADPPA